MGDDGSFWNNVLTATFNLGDRAGANPYPPAPRRRPKKLRKKERNRKGKSR